MSSARSAIPSASVRLERPTWTASADAQDITAIEKAARNSVQLKTTSKAGGGRPSLIGPRGRTWPGDDGVIVEQERRILNEDGIGVISKLGQPNDLETRRPQRLFIIGVLARRLRSVDGNSLKMRQLALVEARADGTCESLPISPSAWALWR